MRLSTICVSTLLCFSRLVAAEEQSPREILAAWSAVGFQSEQELKEINFKAAAASAERAMKLAKQLGPNDTHVASTYYLLGVIHRDWGHCAAARTNYQHAIAIWLKQPTPNPPYVFNGITGLISTMCECDDFKSAEKILREYDDELARYKSGLLDDAKLLSIRAVIARGEHRYTEAYKLLEESIALMEQVPKVSPVDIAVQRSTRAVALDKSGRHADALAEAQRAIDALQGTAPFHPAYVAALNNSACSLAALGRRDEAERMFQRALTAARATYGGEDNQFTAKIMLSYARVLRDNKQTPAAEALRRHASEVYRQSLNRDNATIDVEELRASRK